MAFQCFNPKDAPYNAAGNGTTDDYPAFRDCLNDTESVKGVMCVPPGSYKITQTLVHDEQDCLIWFSPGAILLNFTGGTCFAVDLSGVGGNPTTYVVGPHIENRGNQTGPVFELRESFSQIAVSRPKIYNPSSYACDVGIRVRGSNGCQIYSPWISGEDGSPTTAPWFNVGLMIENSSDDNRGNVQVFGGVIGRCSEAGVRVTATGGGLFNNFGFFGTKVVNGMTAPNGSIGVDLAIDPDGGNVQNFHLSNLHIERFETGLRLSGVDNVVVDAPVITGPDGGLDGILIEGADRICQGVFINVPFIKAFQTQQSTGTGIRLTNHAHNRIVIRRPIISDVDARISNAATGPLNEIRDENPTYTITNYDTDRSYNAGSTSVAELADVLGTLINDLRTKGIVA